MTSFGFMESDEFRKSIESDYGELTNSFKNSNWKSVLVLSGSIIEALLVDYIDAQNNHTETSALLKKELSEIITTARRSKIISDDAEKLSHIIRDYRNLIHPSRLVRTKAVVDANRAEVAKILVDIILKEIAAKRRDAYGYTAEQIVDKVISDSSAVGILVHIIKGTKENELKRLLISILPERFIGLAAWSDTALDSAGPDDYGYVEDQVAKVRAQLTNLQRCYRAAFECANEETRMSVVKQYISVLKERSEEVVGIYETNFFASPDLKYLDETDRGLAIRHLFSRFEKNKTKVDARTLEILQNIGPFLTKQEVNPFVDMLVRTWLYEKSDAFNEDAKFLLFAEAFASSAEISDLIQKRIGDWLAKLEKLEQPLIVSELKETQSLFEIPF